MFRTTLIIFCCYGESSVTSDSGSQHVSGSHLSDVSLSHSGSPWGDDYYHDTLDPEETLPTITSTSQTLAVMVGDPVLLPCDVHNLGTISLSWRRGVETLWVLKKQPEGPLLQAVSQDHRLGRNGTSLTLSQVQPDHQGIYTCEIATQPPRTLSHTLTVKVPPSVYPINNRSTVTVKMGGAITLSCQASGNPTPKVTWSRKGGNLPGPAHGASLTLDEVVPEDNGMYMCMANNGVGKPATATVTLSVMHPPKVWAENEEVFSGVTYDATLACYVDAEPPPQVKWYRVGDIPVDPLRLIRTVNPKMRYSLQFDHVNLDDFGDYTCNATNMMGNSSTVIRLSGRPKPVRFTSSNQGKMETNYTLVWQVESYAPILSYNVAYRNESGMEEQWVNFTVPGTTSSSIYHSMSHTFNQLEPGASYSVQVTAKNEFGECDNNETFTFTTFDPSDQAEEKDTILVIDLLQGVVSEVVGVNESQATPMSGVDDADSSDDPSRMMGSVTEGEQVHKKKVPNAETMAVQDDSSGAFTFTLTPAEKRAQMVAFVTAISLSCFFL
ncbi:protein amalgam-like isoform X3 [Homarus americanus]|uniref:protein amalgam-like isoform X3 n=1 Tax=Homarus americanus TaxID=6706 RepID=UPI001C45B6D7|nr:protein amalgam-like isoform X3 [Homarus americanus]